MDGGEKVWAPHPVQGYQLGQIVDVGADTLTVQPLASSEQVLAVGVYYQCRQLDLGLRAVGSE